LCGHFAAKRRWVDEVDERALAVDLDHRQPLAVARLELRIAADVDLLQLEGNLAADLRDDFPGSFAEVAALSVVQGDPGYG
jgi:hypothetical protein